MRVSVARLHSDALQQAVDAQILLNDSLMLGMGTPERAMAPLWERLRRMQAALKGAQQRGGGGDNMES